MNTSNALSYPTQEMINVCNEGLQDRISNICDVRSLLCKQAVDLVGSFKSRIFFCHDNIINSILNKYPYRKSKDIEFMFSECSAIYGVISILLHSENYFFLDLDKQKFTFNKFYWRHGKAIFYKPIIRNLLIVEFGILKHRVEYLTELTIKLILNIITNRDYFEENLDIQKTEIKNDMRKMNAAAKFQFKCLILDYLLYTDMKQCEISKRLGVDRKTIREIQKKLEVNPNLSYEDLFEKKHGPKRDDYTKITEDAWEDFEVACQSLPRSFDLKYAGWCTQAICEFFKRFHNITVTTAYLRYYLRKRNYTCKVGRRKNPKQNPETVKKFLQVDYKKELTCAKENGEWVLFEDEMYIQQGYSNKSYAKKNKPSVSSYHQSCKHTNHSLITLIGIGGFFEIFIVDGPVDSEWIIFYFKELKKKYPGTKFLVFLDNSRVHDSKALEIWLKRKNGGKGVIMVAYLPAYSPEMNPVEFFNHDFHDHLKKLNLESSKDVLDEAYKYIAWYRDNKAGDAKRKVNNFFFADPCKYSIDIYNEVFETNIKEIKKNVINS